MRALLSLFISNSVTLYIYFRTHRGLLDFQKILLLYVSLLLTIDQIIVLTYQLLPHLDLISLIDPIVYYFSCHEI